MATYVMLTRLTPEAVKVPGDLKKPRRRLPHTSARRSQVKWLSSFAILGPYDYMDLFDAPDEDTAARVVMIVRSFGHAQTETWTALPWERFENLISTVLVPA
jgi:uncharacterized protein with GYD domain